MTLKEIDLADATKVSIGVIVKNVAVGMEYLWFKYRAGQIGRNLANGSPSLRRFFGAVLPRRQAAEKGPATSFMFRRNNASIIKILFNIKNLKKNVSGAKK